MNQLKKKIQNLKLSGIVKTLESRNKYAIENQLSYIDFLELLIEDEYANRCSNSYNKRLNKSKLDTSKTIETYDFTYQPELNKKEILDLASCRFIQENIFMGNPSGGKTHLANALKIEALKQGSKVIFCSCQ
ncbi:hypothetical protein JCM12298_22740 [Desulfothermus naphthae]